MSSIRRIRLTEVAFYYASTGIQERPKSYMHILNLTLHLLGAWWGVKNPGYNKVIPKGGNQYYNNVAILNKFFEKLRFQKKRKS